MAQLWGGRFTKETDQLVYNFNASISFDKRFYEQDIRGSIAHVTMLAKQGILTEEEKKQIIDGLNGIREETRDYRQIRRYSQLCRGESDRPDRRCRKETAYRTQQERSGCTGYEIIYKR